MYPIIANIESQASALITPMGFAAFLIYAIISVGMLLAVFKIFDRFTPGDLIGQVVEHKNVAAAILGSTVLLCATALFIAAMH